MSIETLGEAYAAHWKVHVACDGCDLRERVDMRALLWTRGRGFPLTRMDEVMRCPRCGNRKVRVTFDVPGNPRPPSKDLVAVPDRYAVEQLDARGQVVEVLKRDRFDAAVHTWERQVQRHRSGSVIMRDGARVVREWPSRET